MRIINTKERIIQFIDSKGISKSDFLIKTNIKRGFLDKDKMGVSVSDHFLAKIIGAFPELNIEWLITGKGEMIKNNHTNGNPAIPDSKSSHMQRIIPLFSLSDLADAVHIRTVGNNWPETITIPHMPICDAAVYIHGDSMYPIIKTGDIACYKRVYDMNEIYWGEMYLIEIFRKEGNYITLKYIHRSQLGSDYFSLHSRNSDYPPQDILKSSILRLALVKVCIRYNTLI